MTFKSSGQVAVVKNSSALPLAEDFKDYFDPDIRFRGHVYYSRGAARIISTAGGHILAEVRGKRDASYPVELHWDYTGTKSILRATCACPFYEGGDMCKHVWAVFLKLDSTGQAAIIPQACLQFLLHDQEEDSEDSDVLDDDDDGDGFHVTQPQRFLPSRLAPVQKIPLWQMRLSNLCEKAKMLHNQARHLGNSVIKRVHEAWYMVDKKATGYNGRLTFNLYQRSISDTGKVGRLKQLTIAAADLPFLTNADDKENLNMLLGSHLGGDSYHGTYGYSSSKLSSCRLPHALYDTVLPKLFATGRVGYFKDDRPYDENLQQLTWTPEALWRFEIQVTQEIRQKAWKIWGCLRCGEQTRDLKDALMISNSGLVLFDTELAKFDGGTAYAWIEELQNKGAILVPRSQQEGLVGLLASLPGFKPECLPEDLRVEEKHVEPRLSAVFAKSEISIMRPNNIQPVRVRVRFEYEGHKVRVQSATSCILDEKRKTLYVRNRIKEQEWLACFDELGMVERPQYSPEDCDYTLDGRKMAAAAVRLLELGGDVQINKGMLRRSGPIKMGISSGIDWFDLSAKIDFDGEVIALPQLLAAVKSGERLVNLRDGSAGVLPDDIFKRLSSFAGLGKAQTDGSLRFIKSQAMLLDGLLAAQPHVERDDTFRNITEQLKTFSGVKPADQPSGFHGQLRGYQKDGLGWMHFLQDFGLGGCLADDMGLGKTIQVLALLEERRQTPGRLSLIVAPKSLVYNWMDEAARFTPALRVFNLTGMMRGDFWTQKDQYDLVVTSYGTLRRDIETLKDIPFDYVILDEAQCIKNSSAQTAKASWLLGGQHRLALSGTPVENHLGDLWSIFEFLNKGSLGASQNFKNLMVGRTPSPETVEVLAKGLAPFILRRTKAQVLPELPPKTEQTLYCVMDKEQQALYTELTNHFRASLNKTISIQGMAKSKIHVLEALLRLRQAACHPGLLDAARRTDESTKLQSLMEQLREIRAEGHKALVFSQFTSFLSIVRERFETEKWPYEYLDGKTQDRKSKVEHFQTDPDCGIFLISLKAGGFGLNLTAADYVFILDPWWNPAVEAQAIDRTHRIGQKQHVFAYRLITKGTVEEKILELQARKKGLAEAIISENSSLLQTLTWEDLQLLLA